jgi:hypothetical protein
MEGAEKSCCKFESWVVVVIADAESVADAVVDAVVGDFVVVVVDAVVVAVAVLLLLPS